MAFSVLIAGGMGFIGSNFIQLLMIKRPDVNLRVIDFLTYAGRVSNISVLSSQFESHQADIQDDSLVSELVSKSDLVVNFVAESHNDNSLRDPEPFVFTNVVGTFRLIEACAKFGVRYHHISTDEVFGDLPLDGVEKFTPGTPYNPSSPYSSTKASSDLLVWPLVRSFGLRATISNCSNNYGPRQHEEKFIPRTIVTAIPTLSQSCPRALRR